MIAEIRFGRAIVEGHASRLALLGELQNDVAPYRLAQRFKNRRQLDLVAVGVTKFPSHAPHLAWIARQFKIY
jgi:hypothetical protein